MALPEFVKIGDIYIAKDHIMMIIKDVPSWIVELDTGVHVALPDAVVDQFFKWFRHEALITCLDK